MLERWDRDRPERVPLRVARAAALSTELDELRGLRDALRTEEVRTFVRLANRYYGAAECVEPEEPDVLRVDLDLMSERYAAVVERFFALHVLEERQNQPDKETEDKKEKKAEEDEEGKKRWSPSCVRGLQGIVLCYKQLVRNPYTIQIDEINEEIALTESEYNHLIGHTTENG